MMKGFLHFALIITLNTVNLTVFIAHTKIPISSHHEIKQTLFTYLICIAGLIGKIHVCMLFAS